VAVKTGGDKGPELPKNDRKGDQHPGEGGDFEIGEEGLGGVDEDQRATFGQGRTHRLGNVLEEFFGKAVAAEEGDDPGGGGDNQALAQLFEMGGEGQLVIRHGWGPWIPGGEPPPERG